MSDYSNLTKKEASALISEQLKIARAVVAKAKEIADATGVDFSLNIGGYGMGGWYRPVPTDLDGDWNESGCSYIDEDDFGWQASSQSC